MPKHFRLIVISVLLAASCSTPQKTGSGGKTAAREKPSALEKYVAAPDAAYAWKKISQEKLESGATFHEIILTSQTWRGIEWKHRLYVITPKEFAKKEPLAILIVLGGKLTDRDWKRITGEVDPSGKAARRKYGRELNTVAQIANAAGIPIAGLLDVPNQPLFGGLYEDNLIAYTFDRFRSGGGETWPLLLPMAKSAARAMDAVEEYMKSELDTTISGFLVTGASKRGWTTWLTPVADKRVKAIAPIVYDNLDLASQMKHQLEMWGEFSRKIKPYTDLGLPQEAAKDAQWTAKLGAIVDPLAFSGRISVPKLIVIGTNDKYWPLDALNIYYDRLDGEKRILYIPNGDHGLGRLGTLTAVKTIIAFAMKTDGRLSWPDFDWDISEEGDSVKINLTSSEEPQVARAFFAFSRNTDFREAEWKSVKMEKENSAYTFTFKKPAKGFIAVLARARFPVAKDIAYTLSTNVKIFKGREEK